MSAICAELLAEALTDACLTYVVHGQQPPQKWSAALAKYDEQQTDQRGHRYSVGRLRLKLTVVREL